MDVCSSGVDVFFYIELFSDLLDWERNKQDQIQP